MPSPQSASLSNSGTRLPRPWQRNLLRFFGRAWVEVAIGLLVLASVGLTLVEFTWNAAPDDRQGQETLAWVELAGDAITVVFAIELFLRFLAWPSKKRFFREYWLDIVAVLPLFRVFRAVRVVRLLRLARLLRLFGVASRLSSHFPYIMRRGLVEYLFVCGMLALTVLFGTGAMMYFEGGRQGAPVAPGAPGRSGTPDDPAGQATDGGEEPFSLEYSFWFSVYSLLAGEPIPNAPRTLGGRIVAVFVMFMGLTIFAMLTGTVSAFMVERLQSEAKAVDWDHLHDHIVLCGWNSKAEIIVREYQASHVADTPIAVIAELEHQPQLEPDLQRQLQFLNDDFTRIPALEKAGIHRARTCIILSDTSQGRSEQDADARTILAALTVEKLNPRVYTCAELLNRSYASHLKMGNVNDFVVSGEYSAYMLAQAAMNHGLMDVISELMTYQHGNGFYRLSLPADWIGRTFQDAFGELKRDRNVILVGVQPAGERMRVNPDEYVFQAGDEVVVISTREIKL